LRCDAFVFLSGYTSDDKTLEDQVPQVTNSVASGLMVAGAMWDKLVKLSLFLHRSQKLETLKELLKKGPALPANCRMGFSAIC
jgi:enamine deaminase RidA (YjgF/YER057c/UK114 family)